MQDINEDTEWNDILRSKGIIPPKPSREVEISEKQIQTMLDSTIEQHVQGLDSEGKKKIEDMNLDELDELEDSEEEEILKRYRQKRIAEMRALSEKAKFGIVSEISGQDYVNEVTKAGEGIWVVLHLYAPGVPMCALIHHYMKQLSSRFPHTKFLRSIATTCIPNFPEKNLPTIFVYYEGTLKKQFVGAMELRGEKLLLEELEYILGQTGAIKTDIQDDPQPQIKDKMISDLKNQSIDFY